MSGFFDSLAALKVVYWLVGGGGIIALIALFVFLPAVGRGLVALLVSIIREMLGTRIGCAFLAAIVVGLGVNYMRASIDSDEFAERTAKFEELQRQRDEQIRAETRKQVEAEQDALRQSAFNTDQAVKDFANEPPKIATPATDPLRVGDDACRLRFIAGLPPCRSEGARGVSKARAKAAAAVRHARQQLPVPGGTVAGPVEESQ